MGSRGGGALAKYGDVEIDEEANRQSQELQIGNDLCQVDRKQPLYRLDFDDQSAFHHEVEEIAAIEVKAFVLHRNRDLTLSAKSTQR